MKKPILLITGGAGFIGSHTADALAKKGYKIRILDNLARPVHNGRWPNYLRGKSFELVRGDVTKKADWLKALRDVAYVYHLAAYQDQLPDFSKFFRTNTVSTALLYELILVKRLPVKKVVLASSQFIYGDGMYRCNHNGRLFPAELRTLDQLEKKQWDIRCSHGSSAEFQRFREDQQPMPTNSYGLSKVALENLALRLGKTYGIPTTILRYSIVQGPRQSPYNLYSGALRIFVSQALAGRPITVYEDGKQLRDFVNINDVVAANVLALRNRRTDFEIFNVGGGKGWRVLDFAKLVWKITGSSSAIKLSGFRRTDSRNAVSDIGKLKKLGWRPRFGPEKSVRDYVSWFKEQKFDPAKLLGRANAKQLL